MDQAEVIQLPAHVRSISINLLDTGSTKGDLAGDLIP
jgi:hypothetical protein